MHHTVCRPQASQFWAGVLSLGVLLGSTCQLQAGDHLAELQAQAIQRGSAAWGHWGWEADKYTLWGTHSNRLVPVFTYGTRGAGKGVDLKSYTGENSPYRNEAQLRRIYGRVPADTLDPKANYLDQTNIFDLQRAALEAGRKHIILVVFDGMDWQTLQAAAIYNQQAVTYQRGRGAGTHLQDYRADKTSQFGFMVTSPHNDGTSVDVNTQTVKNPGGETPGGYNRAAGGQAPWAVPADPGYLVSQPDGTSTHAYTDSASSATSMTAGIKTYNNSIGVGPGGEQVPTIAHLAQQMGMKVGIVSSVPISHATPAAAYAHNVHRNDYQDISRDLLGLPSVSHPERPLPGMDVVVGGGYGTSKKQDAGQGKNFEPGNMYLADSDLERAAQHAQTPYVVCVRREGVDGSQAIQSAAAEAASNGKRLLGFFGVGDAKGHLPFATANRDFKPVAGRTGAAEEYTAADVEENPELSEMTAAALTVLNNEKGFWLMVEAGDVDWANHDNNLDNSIGALNSGDAAVRVVTDWVEQHSSWNETLLIVTADHGHYLVLENPEALIGK